MNTDTTKQLWSAGKTSALVVLVFVLLALVTLAQLPPTPAASAFVGPPAPRTLVVTLMWDHSPTPEVIGYRMYRSYTKTNPDWVVASLVAYTNRVTVLATNTPVWFACSAVATNGESELSNFVGIMGEDEVVTVWSECSAIGPAGPFKYLAPVITVTNPPEPMKFYRVGISNQTKLRVE